MKKFTAWVLCLAMMMSGLVLVRAEAGGGNEAAQLWVDAVKKPSRVRQEVHSSPRHDNAGDASVYYYGMLRKPVELTGDSFESCYPYLCYGTGSVIEDIADNHMAFTLSTDDAVPLEAGDVAYVSFYYRSASRFIGEDQKEYTGMMQVPQVRFNSNGAMMYELHTGSTALSPFVPDDTWHKVEYYIPLDEESAGAQVKIGFLQLDSPAYIELTGIRYGSMRLGAGDTYSNQKAYTYLGKLLQQGVLKSLTVDGAAAELKPQVYSYAMGAETDQPTVVAENVPAVTRAAEVTKTGAARYEIKVYAPGYDPLFGEDAQRSYLGCLAEDGSFDATAEPTLYSVKNQDHFSIYTLNLNLKAADVVVKVKGIEGKDIGGCVAGDRITIEETLLNVDGTEQEFVTLLVFYKDGALVDVVPYQTKLTKEQDSVTPVHEYILSDGDYSGMTVDCFVIETATYGDVLR